MSERSVSRLPDSVKDVLREFTVGYLLESHPPDVLDFGLEYFTRLQKDRLLQKRPQQQPIVTMDIETIAQEYIAKNTILEEPDDDYDVKMPKICRTTRISHSREDIFVSRLRDSLLFRNLDLDEIKAIIRLMYCLVLKFGDFVYQKGDFDDKFCIIERGKLSVTTADGRIEKTLSSFDYIGELALLYNYPRQTTVRVDSDDAVLWTICRKTFRQYMTDTARAQLKTFQNHLKTVPIFKSLSDSESRKVSQAMSVKRFHEGQRIFAQGEIRKGIYFIVSGRVSLQMKNTNGIGSNTLATLEKGDYLGELSLITLSGELVSAFAETDVKSVFLCLDAFRRLVGNGIELIKREMNQF